MPIWWNLPTSSWDTVHTSTFRLKFGSLSPAVTLKIRSRSSKPSQLFIMSQYYIHANLVKIHPWFTRYRTYKNVSRRQRWRQRDAHQKQYVPLPLQLPNLNRFPCQQRTLRHTNRLHCLGPGAVARSEASSLGMQVAQSSIPTSSTFFRLDLVMKIFLRPFSLFCWFKTSSCQLLGKECALSTGKLPRRLAQKQCG